MTIMVIEDDEDLNEVLCFNLRKEGYETIPILDGDEAVRSLDLADTAPDLILLDIMLPGRSGWSICQYLADQHVFDSLPVVIFTAKSAREDYDRARKFRNFAGYFVKPYTTKDVLRHVKKVLDRTAA